MSRPVNKTSVKAKAPAKIEAVAAPILVVPDRACDKKDSPKIAKCLHVRQYTGLGPVRFWAVLAANDRGQWKCSDRNLLAAVRLPKNILNFA